MKRYFLKKILTYLNSKIIYIHSNKYKISNVKKTNGHSSSFLICNRFMIKIKFNIFITVTYSIKRLLSKLLTLPLFRMLYFVKNDQT